MYLKFISLDKSDIFLYYAIIFLYTINIVISILSVIIFNINGLFYVNAGLLFTDLYFEMQNAGINITCKKIYYMGYAIFLLLIIMISSHVYMDLTMIDFWALMFPYTGRIFLMIIATLDCMFLFDHFKYLKKYLNNLIRLNLTEFSNLELQINNIEKAIRFFDTLIQIGNKFNRLFGFLLLLNIFSNAIEIVFVVMTFYIKETVPENVIFAYLLGNIIYAMLYYICQSINKKVGNIFFI